MKKIFYVLAVVGIFASCSEKKEDTTVAEVPIEKPKPEYPYPIRYSDWEIGNPENIKTVLNLYSVWDKKDSGKMSGFFADSVKLRVPTERREITIPNDKIEKLLGENRGNYDSTSNNILSAVSLHDKESNEDWVMITTYNKWVEKNGTRDSVLYHDNWQLKDGKITFLMSFYKLPTQAFLKKNDPKK